MKDEFKHLPQQNSLIYSYLLGVAMIYMMLMMLSGLLIYKIVRIGAFMAPMSIFLTPLIYCLSNVTTEVYGYQVSRNMLWWFIISSALFCLLSYLLVHIPSPTSFKHQAAYNLILGTLPIIFIAGTIGTLCGISMNNYLVSKFKIAMEGKNYWLRSILSTCGGEITYNIIAYPIMYAWTLPPSDVFHLLLSATIFKFSTTIICIFPEVLLANYLKMKEKINVFDYNVNYNIFKFKLMPPSPRLIKS